ncbi:hypothetical protein ACJIZ3_003272 [Penstemon smallii]|uniref:Hydroxyproline-rich glycoprotein family protein n=1 Tax=Penstemon smallii TaxID=265156 RepID=A0ABD3U8R8_9LAMI
MKSEQDKSPINRKRWGGCWGGLSCFRKQKGGKRIVPASRMIDNNGLPNHSNGPQANGLPNHQATGIPHSLYAPPSSPASFSNSALPSTAQSPTPCFLSANSPENPSFVTGPYAHETQLVSPPVFSTFTTEPSTAPLTPPPELAHLTTPSSPDVPYARFLSSNDKTNYDCLSQWDASQEPTYKSASKSRQDSNFFCPETFAQFYFDQSSFSNGRLSISRESDAYSNVGNGHQNRQNKPCKPDAEELEAYRASFGFSADEIITTTHYVEILNDDSFSMTTPFSEEQRKLTEPAKGVETEKGRDDFPSPQLRKAGVNHADGVHSGPLPFGNFEDQVPHNRLRERSLPINYVMSDDEEDIYSKMGASSRIGRKYALGSSNSDAEIEYRRGRSLREGHSRRES